MELVASLLYYSRESNHDRWCGHNVVRERERAQSVRKDFASVVHDAIPEKSQGNVSEAQTHTRIHVHTRSGKVSLSFVFTLTFAQAFM